MEAGRRAIDALEEIATALSALKRPFSSVDGAALSALPEEMRRAVAIVGDSDLTPMAAVAGTIADATADFLADRGLTRIMVNNGGDVAIRLKQPEFVTVGVRPDVAEPEIRYAARITAGMGVGGVCTSGLGGRSLTRGVANAAVVFASRASTADAAATAIANATYVPSPEVRRVLAETLDPHTDLKGVAVTQFVGELPDQRINAALQRGIAHAERRVRRGVILGACIAVKGRMAVTPRLLPVVEPLINQNHIERSLVDGNSQDREDNRGNPY